MPASFFELQRFAVTGLASTNMTDFDKMRARALFPQSYPSTTVTGIPPLTFKANGKPLESWIISGNSQQNGIPTPDAPVDVQSCGDWDADANSYKIPITCGSQITPICLGQVQTTRRIKKLVLNGTEYYGTHGGNTWVAIGTGAADFRGTADGAICSHLPLVLRSNFTTNTCAWGMGQVGDFLINIDNKNITDLRSYIVQQHSAGTPVTVWYILATPETGIVNEPLCKIGDYADTVASTNTGAPSIPTVKGQNTLTVDTDLQPSSVTITT